MFKMFTAMFAGFTLSLLALAPAQAQIFKIAMADNAYEQNIPDFRRLGLMGATGDAVNLDVVAGSAYDMAVSDGSIRALPANAQTKDGYMSFFRQKNGLSGQTMPLAQFRALVNSRGIYLLATKDFAPPEAPAAASTPQSYVQQIGDIERRVTALEKSPSLTPAEKEALASLKANMASIAGVRQQLLREVDGAAGNQAILARVNNEAKGLISSLANVETNVATLEASAKAAAERAETAAVNSATSAAAAAASASEAKKSQEASATSETFANQYNWAIWLALALAGIALAWKVASSVRRFFWKPKVSMEDIDGLIDFTSRLRSDVDEAKELAQNTAEQVGVERVGFSPVDYTALKQLPTGKSAWVAVLVNGEEYTKLRFERAENGHYICISPTEERPEDYSEGTELSNPLKLVRKAYRDGKLPERGKLALRVVNSSVPGFSAMADS